MRILNGSLLVIGALHMVLGVITYWPTLADMSRSELIDSINGSPQKAEAFWYFITGFMVITSGFLIRYYTRDTGRQVPLPVGLILLSMSLIGIILMPVGGFWLFLPQSISIIVTGFRTGR